MELSKRFTDKKVGDHIVLFETKDSMEVYKIQHIPDVFKSNRLATDEEIKAYAIKTKLAN